MIRTLLMRNVNKFPNTANAGKTSKPNTGFQNTSTIRRNMQNESLLMKQSAAIIHCCRWKCPDLQNPHCCSALPGFTFRQHNVLKITFVKMQCVFYPTKIFKCHFLHVLANVTLKYAFIPNETFVNGCYFC